VFGTATLLLLLLLLSRVDIFLLCMHRTPFPPCHAMPRHASPALSRTYPMVFALAAGA